MRKHFLSESFFGEFNSESCYWAGFIAADGCIYKNSLLINLKLDDVDHLQKLKQIICFTGNVKSLIPKREACLICINSKKLVDDLKKNFNIVSRKSLVLGPPEILPENMIRHFIRGFLDGDGCFYNNENTSSISIVGTYNVLIWIKDQIQKNCSVGNPFISQATANSHRIGFNGRLQCMSIINWLYNDVPENLYLQRKFEKSREVFKHILKKQDEEKTVVGLYKSGFSINNIVKSTFFKYYRVYRILTDAGIKIKNTNKLKLNTDEMNKILDLRNLGFKIKDISKKVGISHTRISTFLHFYKNELGDTQ